MISRQQIQIWSNETKRLHWIAMTALIASSVTLAGCQQMGFRSRSDELKQMLAEQDDWGLPQSPPSRVPRPSPIELMGKKKSDANKRVASDGSKDADRRSMQIDTNKPEELRASTDETDLNNSSSSIILNTPYQELDIEGAMATLPSAYRDILRKTLDAAERQSKMGESEISSLSDNGPSRSDKQKAIDRSIALDMQVAARETNNAKATGKVTVRMSDADADDQNGMALRSIPKSLSEASVVNAVAVSEPKIAGSDPTGSHIQRASSVVPLPANTLSAASHSPSSVPSLTGSDNATTSPSSWRQLLNQTIDQLEKQIKEIPPTDENLRISQEVTLRMLYLCQRRLNDATREIDVLSDQEQDYFRHQMQALYEASNPDAMPVRSRHWSLVMNSQREATNLLAAISNLEVKSAAFCIEVEGYGVVTKFPKYQFKPDEELLLYCEVENVAATKGKQGYESQLQGSYEIIDSQGRKVADQLLPVEAEICQNHRRDYFIVYKIFMPQQIAPGNYQLRLTVEDTKARKFGQNHLDFQIKK